MKTMRLWLRHKQYTLTRWFNRVRQAVFGPVVLTRKDIRTMKAIANKFIADNPYIDKCHWVYASLVPQIDGEGEYQYMRCRFDVYYKVADRYPWHDRGLLLQLPITNSMSGVDEMMASDQLFVEIEECIEETLSLSIVPSLVKKYEKSSYDSYWDALHSDEHLASMGYTETLKSDSEPMPDSAKSE